MSVGIDFSFSRVPADFAKANGFAFAVSYLTDQDTTHAVKQWTAPEIAAYRAAGLGVVAVWQGGGQDRHTVWREGFARGARDAGRAATESGRLGRPTGPGGRPVYFAIDTDVQPDELHLVAAYFDGIASVFDIGNIGVYGGRRVMEWAMASGKARWFWQTGSAWPVREAAPGIHLYQRQHNVVLGPYNVDVNDSMKADYGQWFDVPGGQDGWYPGAQRLELPEAKDQAAIRPTQFVVHSIKAPWDEHRLREFWQEPGRGDESHFGLDFDGSLGQYVPTTTAADANIAANRRPDGTGAVSVETASNLDSTDRWTDAQVRVLVDLGVWMHRTWGVPLRICRTHDDPGFGYHRLHWQWSVREGGDPAGKTACPGPARITQFESEVFPAIVRAAQSGPDLEEEMKVLGGELRPGFDPVSNLVIPPTVPDGRRMFVNIGADLGKVRGRVDAFVTGQGWRHLGMFDVDGNSDLAFYALPSGTRKVNIKRLPGDGVSPDTPAAWNVEIV